MDGNLLVNRNSSLKVITKEPRSPDWEVSIHVPGTLLLHSSQDIVMAIIIISVNGKEVWMQNRRKSTARELCMLYGVCL